MIKCTGCGQTNDFGGNFCRFCGIQLVTSQNGNQQFVQHRPYAWKTDEFPVADKGRRPIPVIDPVRPGRHPSIPQNSQYYQQMAYPKPGFLVVQGYRCPRCNSQNLPYVKRQISTAGWITFAVLLATTGIFFWIGLLIREDVRVCPICQTKIGSI